MTKRASSALAEPESGGRTLPDLARRETDDGLKVVRFLVSVMDGDIDGLKPSDRLAAARELLDRCFGKPFAASPAAKDDAAGANEAANLLMERIRRALEHDHDANDAQEPPTC